MVSKTEYKHVVIDSTGDAFIEGTRISVAEIVATLDFGKALEERIVQLVQHYPQNYLTNAKIYSALAFFYDHKEQVLASLGTSPPKGFTKDKYENWVHLNE